MSLTFCQARPYNNYKPFMRCVQDGALVELPTQAACNTIDNLSRCYKIEGGDVGKLKRHFSRFEAATNNLLPIMDWFVDQERDKGYLTVQGTRHADNASLIDSSVQRAVLWIHDIEFPDAFRDVLDPLIAQVPNNALGTLVIIKSITYAYKRGCERFRRLPSVHNQWHNPQYNPVNWTQLVNGVFERWAAESPDSWDGYTDDQSDSDSMSDAPDSAYL